MVSLKNLAEGIGPKTKILFGALVIIAAALAIYSPVLHGAEQRALHPWSSDTLGHLLKVEFVAQAFQSGDFYPQLFPDWYGGVQLLRYFPPLPYYLLAGIYLLSGDIVFTGGAFVFGAALVGGLSFLLYRRWLTLIPAIGAGVLFMALPDNIRVAMAEGNLPRVLATAFLPITFYFLLSILTDGPSRLRFLALAILTMVVILSHAMMGAIFVACFTLVAIVYLFTAHAPARAVGTALGAVFGGVLLSGWWLLPSLTGGITELNSEAVGEALASFPLTLSLDPFLRYENKEIFYVGLSLVVGAALAFLFWRRLDPLGRSLILAGVLVVLVASTVFNPVYRTLPLHDLMWPIRFMTFGGFILLLGLAAWVSQLLAGSWKTKLVAVLLMAALAVDVLPSLSLVFLRPASEELVAVAEKVKELPGWRVATADFSRLGSRASYLFSATGQREQVYGWAYQGSGIAPLVSSINFAMERGYSPYAVDRLEELGTDYVVRMKGIPIDPSFDSLLTEHGYTLVQETQSLDLYYRPSGPRAFVPHYPALGIGDGADSLALLFPQMAIGSSPRIDDYPLELLEEFPTLFLGGFSWKDKADAEDLVAKYVASGGRAVVDLTGAPEGVLSKRPKFLGVYGEPVIFYSPPPLWRGEEQLRLRSIDPKYSPWSTLTPQGLDGSTVTFSYLEQEATAVGYKDLEGGRVWFLGMNLAFHSMLTRDPTGIGLLEEVLGLRAGALPQREALALEGYRAGADGYTFDYTLEEDSPLLVPVARHDGTTVHIDGLQVPLIPIGSLTYFPAPAGTHEVRVGFQPTAIYNFGLAFTALAVLLILAVVTGIPGRMKGLARGR